MSCPQKLTELLRLWAQKITRNVIQSFNGRSRSSKVTDLWCEPFAYSLRGIYHFRNNFLQIDIYYGQLKSEEVAEKEAYDVVSFFSK